MASVTLAMRLCDYAFGDHWRLAGLDVRDNELVRLPWSMQKLRLCDLYLSGNKSLPFDDDIYSDHDDAICSVLSDIARRYSCCGAREAIICLWLAQQFDSECLLRKLPLDVMRYVLVPFVWVSRYDEEWKDADELAFREDVGLTDYFEAKLFVVLARLVT
jgi:hypothetical protein